MRYRKLAHTDLNVSHICLGTMTWGTQNTEAEAHEQMDYALAQGVNFWDTAELYPVNPPTAETYGFTEKFIGTWFAKTGNRDKVILASKVAGPGREYIRGGVGFNPQGIKDALDASLKRLQTDYIDLYQLHWPQRGSYHFGQNWHYAGPGTGILRQDTKVVREGIHETLETLGELVKAGKIRHIGLSNESAWGTMQYLELAEKHGLPRVASIQNEMSLMYRINDLDVAEVCLRENIGVLPYSALGAGWLTGKYYKGARPKVSRFALPYYANSQRLTPQAQKAADAYVDVARKHKIEPAQMALAWTLTQPWVASTIIGATTMDQLKTDIGAWDVALDEAVMADIHEVRKLYPMPY